MLEVRDHRRYITSKDYPAFMFDLDNYTANELDEVFLRGPLLFKVK